jgi:hypothetical protein
LEEPIEDSQFEVNSTRNRIRLALEQFVKNVSYTDVDEGASMKGSLREEA